MIIHTLFDLAKARSIDLGTGVNFDFNKFYSRYNGKPIWHDDGYVIGFTVGIHHGIEIEPRKFFYPFDTTGHESILQLDFLNPLI